MEFWMLRVENGCGKWLRIVCEIRNSTPLIALSWEASCKRWNPGSPLIPFMKVGHKSPYKPTFEWFESFQTSSQSPLYKHLVIFRIKLEPPTNRLSTQVAYSFSLPGLAIITGVRIPSWCFLDEVKGANYSQQLRVKRRIRKIMSGKNS